MTMAFEEEGLAGWGLNGVWADVGTAMIPMRRLG